ncbi:MAG: hypothetical protein Q8O38_02995 [Sulfurimicrobium sp.]|nr:hypothetical protein [Sulfurimicrobium sp.]
MNASGFLAPLALGLGLSASVAAAQELVIPDRQRLQSMSHEEYGTYREQMRNRMEGLSQAERDLVRESGANGREQMEKRDAGSGYGQGYGARNGQDAGQGGRPGVGSGGMQGGGQGGGYGRGGGRRR